ncbi:hypothetical protein ACHAQA_006259 [Verticillium albo-atrum]
MSHNNLLEGSPDLAYFNVEGELIRALDNIYELFKRLDTGMQEFLQIAVAHAQSCDPSLIIAAAINIQDPRVQQQLHQASNILLQLQNHSIRSDVRILKIDFDNMETLSNRAMKNMEEEHEEFDGIRNGQWVMRKDLDCLQQKVDELTQQLDEALKRVAVLESK